MMAAEKNKYAAELGRKGGLARAASLTGAERSHSAREAAKGRWDRPPVHVVIKKMIAAIQETGKPHVMYVDSRRTPRHCEVGSDFDRIWSLNADDKVGTYAIGVTFSDVMDDYLDT